MNVSAPQMNGGMCCLKIGGASANAIIRVEVDGVELVATVRQNDGASLTVCFPISGPGPDHGIVIRVEDGANTFTASFLI